jgi:hypothetical protein
MRNEQMLATTTGYGTHSDQPLGLGLWSLVSRAVLLRSAVVAVVIGSALTIVNQSAWIAGRAPLQVLQMAQVFATPFAVVAISQIVAIRRALIDSAKRQTSVSSESLMATTMSHGIPRSAFVIGMMIGSVNAIITLSTAFIQSDDLTAISYVPLAQAYALPLLFGLMSQAISYRRVINQQAYFASPLVVYTHTRLSAERKVGSGARSEASPSASLRESQPDSLASAEWNEPATNANGIYEQLRPMIIWLGLTELAWVGYWLLAGGGNAPTFVAIVVAWIVCMLTWLALVIYQGKRGFFLKHSERLSNLIGVIVVVAFAVALFASTESGRQGLLNAARNTSDMQLISMHILRLLGIGAIVKFLQRELPLHFIILGSLPDILFAVSAVALAVLCASGPLDHNLLIGWHLIGFSAFLGAGISMFFSVPSPLRIFRTNPDTSIVFRFPMLLAPTFTVPLFMIAHLFALVKLFSN